MSSRSIDRTHLPSFTHFNLSFANPDAEGVFVRDGAMTCMIDQARTGAKDGKRVRLPEIAIEDLLDDLFRPIARDGAGIVEVAIKLQRSLAEIAGMVPSAYGPLAMRAADALARCQASMTFEADLECVRTVYRAHWTDPKP